jgi:predicted nucleotidyltransferase
MINQEVQPYLVKVCTILNSHNVEYLVVGGAAVSYYGHNRKSGIVEYNADLKVDLDFWYNPTIENFQKIIKALDDLDVDTAELKNIVFDRKRTFLKIPHKDFHTDFLPIMEGLHSFQASKEKAETIDIGGVAVKVLSFDDLILNKRTVNRETDRSDIDELNKIRKKRRGRGI